MLFVGDRWHGETGGKQAQSKPSPMAFRFRTDQHPIDPNFFFVSRLFPSSLQVFDSSTILMYLLALILQQER